MNLSTLLRDLATLYRRYGDIPVMIETPTAIFTIQRVDDDVWNIEENVTAVIETEQVDNPSPEIPPREKTSTIKSETKPRTTRSARGSRQPATT